mmetsp:Transcript_39618/g.82324  ORF Transcript_39618/g.82324 Transcript_39618/m.82324 type:complete len:266 (+) Transcript_39618:1359-2156(+)
MDDQSQISKSVTKSIDRGLTATPKGSTRNVTLLASQTQCHTGSVAQSISRIRDLVFLAEKVHHPGGGNTNNPSRGSTTIGIAAQKIVLLSRHGRGGRIAIGTQFSGGQKEETPRPSDDVFGTTSCRPRSPDGKSPTTDCARKRTTTTRRFPSHYTAQQVYSGTTTIGLRLVFTLRYGESSAIETLHYQGKFDGCGIDRVRCGFVTLERNGNLGATVRHDEIEFFLKRVGCLLQKGDRDQNSVEQQQGACTGGDVKKKKLLKTCKL